MAVTCDYRRPLRFEDEFEALIRIVAMSAKSIRYTCVMTMGGQVIANLTMTTVCVSRRAERADARRATALGDARALSGIP